MEKIQGQFCPVCKRKNEPDAVLCVYCGAALEAIDHSPPTTEKMAGATIVFPKEPPRIKTDALIPEGGIAIFLLDNPVPIKSLAVDEFVFGRMIEGSPEVIVDLTPYGAFSSGVSRRHAMVRRRKNIYEIIDLDSTNGSWLNEKRMTPTKAYPLPSGSTVRLGQIRLQVIIREDIPEE
jgi:pSer/pThr/pTyr-binding forkhead associated (FHA) protein